MKNTKYPTKGTLFADRGVCRGKDSHTSASPLPPFQRALGRSVHLWSHAPQPPGKHGRRWAASW